MRPSYYPTGRKPQNEKVIPLSAKKPIRLKSAIMGTGGEERGPVCLYELSLLLACFKQSGYSQVACAREISDFNKCFISAKTQSKEGGERQHKQILKNDANKLLKYYSHK